MTRREFLVAAVTLPGAVTDITRGSSFTAVTVPGADGPIAVDALGVTLAHEHVLVDFVGADRVSASRYDRAAAFAKALPHLERLYTLGCRTLVECTPAYLGRNPELLRSLSRASKLQILTNTGYYGAADDKFLPPHAFSEDANQLASRWIREAREGIDGTGIRPAFMKIGVDAGPLSEVDGKLVRAAARTHRATGLPIYSHTGNGVAALAQVAVLEDERAPLGAFVWVHAQNESDPGVHAQVARKGAWVSFDGVGAQSLERHLGYVLAMREAGLLDRVLVSHDAGWYHVGEPDGGVYRPHDLIFTEFLPALRARGLTEREIAQVMVDNPRQVFTPTTG
jgi:predicted metal-dependent phosphotriesterase family hydrolase